MADFAQGGYSLGVSPGYSNAESVSGDQSAWKSFALKDSRYYRDLVEDLEWLQEQITKALSVLYDTLSLFRALLNVARIALNLIDDVLQLLIRTIITLLDELRKVFIQLLEDLLNLGFYFYPHFMFYDWSGAIAKELLTPYGVTINDDGTINIDETVSDKLTVVPAFGQSPGKLRYVYKTQSDARGYGFEQFSKDLEYALTNPRDRWRPAFSSSMGVSGLVLVVAIDDIFSLIRFVIELIDLIFGTTFARDFAIWLANQIAPKLSAAQQYGLGNPDMIENARQFLFDAQNGDLESIYGAVAEGQFLDERVVNARLNVGIFSDTDGADAGDLNTFGFVEDQFLREFETEYLLGSYRSNSIRYQLEAYSESSDIGVYVQRVVRGTPVYGDGASGFGVNRGNCPTRYVNNADRGIRVLYGTKGANAVGDFSIAVTEVLEADPSTLDENHFKGVLTAPPTPASDDDFYFNPETGTLRQYSVSPGASSGTWADIGTPDALIVTIWDEAKQQQILDPIVIWVPRFKLRDESTQRTVEYYDDGAGRVVSRTDTIVYNYGDNYPLSVSSDVTLGGPAFFYGGNNGWRGRLATEFNIPVNDVEAVVGLPKAVSGAVGEADFNSLDYFPTDDMPVRAIVRIGFFTNFFDNNYIHLSANGQTVVIDGGFIGSFAATAFGTGSNAGYEMNPDADGESRLKVHILDFNESSNRLTLQVDFSVPSQNANVLEITASTYKTIDPIGVTSGTYATVQYQAFSQPILIKINRSQTVSATPVTVLSPKQMNVGAIDANLKESWGSVLTGFRFPPEDLVGDVFGRTDRRKPNVGAKYRWRGTKPVDTGVIAVRSTGAVREVQFITPQTSAIVWRDDNLHIYESGSHSFKVYGYGDKFKEAIDDGSATDFYIRARQIMEDLNEYSKYEQYLVGPTDHTVIISGDLAEEPSHLKSPWWVLNLKQWIDIVEPVDNLLKNLIGTVPVPSSIFDGIIAIINAIDLFIKNVQEYIKRIEVYLNRIFRLFEILGGTGFYALAINSAAGSDGFLKRFQDVRPDPALEKVPYVTGFTLIAPDYMGGSQLMSSLFNFLPQGPLPGEPAPGSFEDRFAELQETLATVQEEMLEKMNDAYDTAKQTVEDKVNRLQSNFE